MGPRPDGQSHVAPGGDEGLIVGHLRGQKQVVPPADQSGGRDTLEVTTEVDRVPPRVLRLVVEKPVLVEGRPVTADGGVPIAERYHLGRSVDRFGGGPLGPKHSEVAAFLVGQLM